MKVLNIIPFFTAYSGLPEYFFNKTYMDVAGSMRVWNADFLLPFYHKLMPASRKRTRKTKRSEFFDQLFS